MTETTQDESQRVTLDAWLVTDIGMVREHNEDSAQMEPTRGFFIVADGMGGHAAGEVASAMAVETVKKTLEAARSEIDAFKKAPSDAGRRGLVQLLQNAVLAAHQAVYQRGQAEADKQGMGTTLDVVLVAGPEAFVAHVGDSRTYLVRDGKSSQITTDHTVAEVLVIEGKLTIEEAQVSPLRTILVNAIGVSADVGVEMAHVTLKPEDRLLLCSDGLHDYFPQEEEIAQRLSAEKPGVALAEMVELAKTRGGHDNITGITVHILDVLEAVPFEVNGDATQPVEVRRLNPFADEPTETTMVPTMPVGGLRPAILGSSQALRVTQPMRATENDVSPHGDTLPPSIKAPRAIGDKDVSWDGNTEQNVRAMPSKPTEMESAATSSPDAAVSSAEDKGDKANNKKKSGGATKDKKPKAKADGDDD